ncbi:MAG TPA: hypothetical protein VLX58_18215 [Bryobacteraceae bacterium]|nr:hypothetical protein [Bryobacteraceae bacterium]
MSFVLLFAVVVFVFLAVAFLLLFRNLAARVRKPVVQADWENLFTPSRYKPMQRLLDRSDRVFLAGQPGGRHMARRLRVARIGIFRGYVRCLARDFSRVSGALKIVMVQAPVDRSALAGLLLRQRFAFTLNMTLLEARLLAHSMGWSAPNLDVRSLVETLDVLGEQLRALTLAAQPSAA